MSTHFCFNWVSVVYDLVLPKRKPQEFLDVFNPQNVDEVLEIGAGTGRITKFFADDVKRIVLLDPSEKMLNKAKKKLNQAEYSVGIVEELPFEDDTFDKIVAYDSFHHWIDHIKGLKETLRVLKPNGEFFIIDINPDTFRGKLLILFEKIMRMKSNFFNPDLMKEMLEDNGFTILGHYSIAAGMTYMIHGKK